MSYFTLIKYIGRDFFSINSNLTEDQVREILLRADDESLFQVSEWFDNPLSADVALKLIDRRNGEEWLNKHL